MQAVGADNPLLDASRRLTVPFPCAQCGYDLRMQPIDGRCPECGRPVRTSVRCDDVVLLPTATLHRLVQAISILLAGVILLGIMAGLAPLLEPAGRAFRLGVPGIRATFGHCGVGLPAAVALVGLGGLIYAAGEARLAQGVPAARQARPMLLAGVVAAGLSIVAAAAAAPPPISYGLLAVTVVVWAAGLRSATALLCELARRSGAVEAEALFGLSQYGCALWGVLTATAALLDLGTRWPDPPPLVALLPAVGGLFGLVWLLTLGLCLLWTMGLSALRRRLRSRLRFRMRADAG